MPTPNAMPKKSAVTGSVIHEVLSTVNQITGRRIYWCRCDPEYTSEGVRVIERHVDVKTGRTESLDYEHDRRFG